MQEARSARPELLSPAGEWDAMRAAVAGGADAVYFGLTKYSARQRAANFTREQLPELLAYLHGRNVRGYVTFNTLVFPDELPEAAEFIAAIAAAGADAAIVQDLGLVRLIRRIAPTLPVHASTQMTLTEPRAIEFVRGLGVDRVILARELSLEDIRAIREATPMPLEVFVHGALCMSYSGQCLASEALWGRSANRGLCGQACRLPYRLIVGGRQRNLGNRRYLLSTKDLAAYDCIAELVRLGIAGFKIEGRLKSAAYVAAATGVYREAIDAAVEGRPFSLSPERLTSLAQSYSRGFTRGFLGGVSHQDLVDGRSPKSRGVRIGKVVGRTPRGIAVELDRDLRGGSPYPPRGDTARARKQASLGAAGAETRRAQSQDPSCHIKPGDGIVFDSGAMAENEQGGRVFAVEPAGKAGTFVLTFGTGDVDLASVAKGSIVWKTDDPKLTRELEKSFARDVVVRRAAVSVRVLARLGGPLTIDVKDEAGNEAHVEWQGPLAKALKQPLTTEVVHEQLGRLGNTPFALSEVTIEGDAGPTTQADVMVPKSILNDLRRRAVEAILEQRERRARHAVAGPDALTAIRGEIAARRTDEVFQSERGGSPDPPRGPATRPACARRVGRPAARPVAPSLCVLVRSEEQLEALLAWQPEDGLGRPAAIYCDFPDLRECAGAVARLRQAGLAAAIATPRIAKPGEERFLQTILDCGPDAVLVRHLAGLAFLREHAPALPLVADFSLNAANDLAADLLAGQAARITPSLDLNHGQLASLAALFTPARLEPIVHLHVPMMYTEHCIAAARLGNASGQKSCDRPCDRHEVQLEDRIGARHALRFDVRCGSTLFAARAQTAIEFIPEMLRAGVRHFRIEFLAEDAAGTRAIMDLYSRAAAARIEPEEALRQLEGLVPEGVTRGTWEFA
jgi:putative protease